jgi:NDP-sugar pyrophosphorylase family protein
MSRIRIRVPTTENGPETRAAVLCGGRGERLRPLTDFFQKVMVPVGPKKLPLLVYVIKLIARHGITKITLLTGYRSSDIQDYFGDGSQYGVDLTYSEDRQGTKGSLNAVANALATGVIPRCEELLVYYGDVLADLDLTSLIKAHRAMKAEATLVLARGYALPVGIADVNDDGLISSFREKPSLDLNVTTGCMMAGHMNRIASETKTDLMTHLVPRMLEMGMRVTAFYTEGEWYDVGTVSNYEKLNSELNRRAVNYLRPIKPVGIPLTEIVTTVGRYPIG